MPTGLSWTELPGGPRPGTGAAAVAQRATRATRDVGILLAFRAQAVRRRALGLALLIGFPTVTLAVATLPALLPGAHGTGQSFEILLLVPSAMAAVLFLNIAAGVASGGGRELIAREQAVAYPISATTDHLGALVLAPFNIAWLLQAWVLLGAVAYTQPAAALVWAQPVVLLWLLMATAVGQAVAWTVEAVRRGPAGIAITRGVLVALALVALAIQLTGHIADVLDQIPTVWLVAGFSDWRGTWVLVVLALVAISLSAIVVGALPAHLAARRLPRDEARVETTQHPPRPMPGSTFSLLVRQDRASVWRSVPMRRGVLVLAIGPGLIALFGDLRWSSMTILPGLVVSGGALLFGVNVWSLDGRGALWRENLPVSPAAVFLARAWVLAEFLAVAALLTVGIAALRAGLPSAAEAAALAGALLVVLLQVVAASMRWSLAYPHPVDLRSARATPAPPTAMVGYSARLALTTTLTGLLFSGCARSGNWQLSLLVALPLLLWSAYRLARTAERWQDPVQRSLVVTATAA